LIFSLAASSQRSVRGQQLLPAKSHGLWQLMWLWGIITFCEVIKHQSSLAKVGDFWDKKGIGISPDPFGGSAYSL